jgi:hypothetical protein
MGLAGGGAGRGDSGVRRVADLRGTYATVGQVEKLGDEPGLRFSFSPFVFRK